MGAVPVKYDVLILLEGIKYDGVQYDEHIGYKFKASHNFEVTRLSDAEILVIDEIIDWLKDYNAR